MRRATLESIIAIAGQTSPAIRYFIGNASLMTPSNVAKIIFRFENEEIIMNETIRTLNARKSCRSFMEEQVSEELLDAVLECGTHAPSGRNGQAVKLVAVRDRALVRRLSVMNALGGDGDPFYGAPTVVIVFGIENGPTPYQDACLAMGNMLNAAYSLGLGACYINRAKETFETDEGKALLTEWGITEKVFGVGCMILGYIKGELHPDLPRKKDYILKV